MEFLKKWNTYQKERFPVLVYGSYIFAIVMATYCVASGIAGKHILDIKIVLPMFIVTFVQFLMVRIVDEFKDYEEDCKYRPYRPVPRGLISLGELRNLFIICVVIQIITTLVFCRHAFPFLIALWIVFFLMTKGFFIKKILDKHILLEVLFDEIMMPAIVLYIANFVCPTIEIINNSIFIKFLILSYVVSWIVEVARKVRCKEDEENGVRTYTAVYGIPMATCILSVLEIILFLLQISVLKTFINGPQKIVACVIIAIVIMINILFVVKETKKFAKLAELIGNIYVFAVFLSMLFMIL